jgi:predicted PurR-regulated permease PerM
VRDLLLIAAVFALAWLAYQVRAITVPVLIALGLAYVFNPLVTWLSGRWRVPRWLTTMGLMATGVLVLAALLVAVLPQMISQTAAMTRTIRTFLTRHWETISPYVDQFLATHMSATTDGSAAAVVATDASAQAQAPAAAYAAVQAANAAQQTQSLQKLLDELSRLDFAAIGRVVLQSLGIGASALGSAISTAGYLLFASAIITVCFFTFSWRFDVLVNWPRTLIPDSQKDKALDVLGKMDRSVAAFVRGRLIQACVMGTNLLVGWWLVGVPYWLVLGLLCAVLNLVPYLAGVGMILAVGLSLLSALGATDPGSAQAAASAADAARDMLSNFPWGAVLWPAGVFWAAQLLDNWVIEPLVQGKATNLDPLTVMLAVICGGLLAGLFGMLLAIPVAACIKILAQEVILPELRQYAREH